MLHDKIIDTKKNKLVDGYFQIDFYIEDFTH